MKAEGYNPNDIEVIKIYIIFYFFLLLSLTFRKNDKNWEKNQIFKFK